MEDHCAFTSLLELSPGATISTKLSNGTSRLAILVSIVNILVEEVREKFLPGTKLPFHGRTSPPN
jgi:hypothetical protein